jgi:hypothetical protein
MLIADLNKDPGHNQPLPIHTQEHVVVPGQTRILSETQLRRSSGNLWLEGITMVWMCYT